MVRSAQQKLAARDFLGLGSSIASGAGSKHIVNSHQQYSDAIAFVKSNILEGIHGPAAAGLLYGNNHNNTLNSSNLAFPGMRHPDWNNAISRQQFLSFRNSQGERFMEKSDDSYLLAQASGYGNLVLGTSAQHHSFSANFSTDHSGAVVKKVFPFLAPTPHEQGLPVRVQSIPVASGAMPVGQVPMPSPFFSSLVAGGVSAATQTRVLSSDSCHKQSSAQLTIFYAGNVNVYNDVSLDKAQEIMLAAASGSYLPANVLNTPTGQSAPFGMPCAVGSLSSPDQQEMLQLNLLTGQQVDQFAADQASQSSPPANKQYTESSFPQGQPVVPRALPQARKASLARFLEKRKERVQSKSPYPLTKPSLEESRSNFCTASPTSDDDCVGKKLVSMV